MQPTPVTPTNSSGHILLLTAPVTGSEIASPTPICFCTLSGFELIVTGDTVSSEFASPLPVAVCTAAGDILIPPYTINSGSNSIVVTAAETGVKLGEATAVVFTDKNGVPLATTGVTATVYDTTPVSVTMVAPNGDALTISIT
jgi:hypothetical protein